MDWLNMVINIIAIFVGLAAYLGIMHTKWGREHEEYQYATLCLNGMRNDYLAADRSCGGIDRLLLKLVRASYRSIVSR